ncbi:MAG TPA: hypothetical protein P5076_12795, partial [Myxococcota bacterium]|nr:hypothetical protein [Myxococcota bacterium]
AMREAEQKGQAVEVTETWQVDEQGHEIPVSQEADAEAPTSAFLVPPPPPAPPPEPPARPRPVARFSDGETAPGTLSEAARTPRFAEGTTAPGADAEAAVRPARAEPTVANVPMVTQAEDSPAGRMATAAGISEARLDDVPDFSDAAESELGLLVEPEEAPPGQRKPAVEPDYDYQKAMHDDLSAVPEFEAEDMSQVSKPNAVPLAPPQAPSELDSFWGLADEPTTSPTVAARPAAAPVRGAKPAASVPFPEADDAPALPAPSPAPAARAKAGGARPLPALNVQAVKVTAQPAAARPAAARPAPAPVAKAEPRDQGADLMGSLFSEADDAAEAPAPARGRPAASARPAAGARSAASARPAAGARPAPATRQTAAKGKPLSARPAAAGAKGRPNDLRGPRKATVHFKDGASKRGTVSEIDLDADWIRLEPAATGQGQAEELNALALKAIFLMLPPGLAYPAKSGTALKLRMIDGRNLEGHSPDYHPNRKGFTLFPKLDQANIERILVFNDAIKNIWLEES